MKFLAWRKKQITNNAFCLLRLLKYNCNFLSKRVYRSAVKRQNLAYVIYVNGLHCYVDTVSLDDNTAVATLLSASIHTGWLDETAATNEAQMVKNLNLPAVQKTQV